MRTGVSQILVENGDKLSQPGLAEKIKKGQGLARNFAQKNPITVIWGPPGTGKTHTLSQIAIDFCAEKKNLLILSHSNVSVDGAINNIIKILKDESSEAVVDRGYILRYGYVKDTELASHAAATSYNYVLNNNNNLKYEKENIYKKFKEIRTNQGKLTDMEYLKERRKEIVLEIKKLEKLAIMRAKIVATTVSKAALEPLFYEDKKFDVVIFDESSMAYVPQLRNSSAWH